MCLNSNRMLLDEGGCVNKPSPTVSFETLDLSSIRNCVNAKREQIRSEYLGVGLPIYDTSMVHKMSGSCN